MNKPMLVGTDFSGIGAFEFALKKLNIAHETITACEINAHARKAYLANHDTKNMYTDVHTRPIPTDPLDIYQSSPPCQAFSDMGKQQGEQDPRGMLFYNTLAFIRRNKPKMFIIENVKGLKSVDDGKVFLQWQTALAGKSWQGSNTMFPPEHSIPYHIYYFECNSINFGVPQHRERIFFVGFRNTPKQPFTPPWGTRTNKVLADIIDANANDDRSLYLTDAQVAKAKAYGDRNHSFGYVFNDGTKPSTALLTGGMGYGKTIYKHAGGGCRKLSPLETWRLQGIPDYAVHNAIQAGVSKNQLWKQAGNTITVNVIAEIIKEMLKAQGENKWK